MVNDPSIQFEKHTVAQCLRCGHSHDFQLAVRTTPPASPTMTVFGGPGARAGGGLGTYEVVFTCPETDKIITLELENRSGVEILGPADEVDLAALSAPSPPQAAVSGELAEWAKNSRAIAIDYCKTMLSTSTSAIPVYFVLLKYIGFEHLSGALRARAAIFPPLLFLAAGITFGLALRPLLANITDSEFAAFRAKRLSQLNGFIKAGAALFVAGICLAIVLFFSALINP
jgi:hypothetical protein